LTLHDFTQLDFTHDFMRLDFTQLYVT
jgi:hypothetical protein